MANIRAIKSDGGRGGLFKVSLGGEHEGYQLEGGLSVANIRAINWGGGVIS